MWTRITSPLLLLVALLPQIALCGSFRKGHSSDPCPFGYGCGGGGGHMSQATKEEVASILGNILKNLQTKKGLMQTGGTVDQVSEVVVSVDATEAADVSAAVGHELKSMLAKISSQTSASAADALKSLLRKAYPNFNEFLGADRASEASGTGDRHPIDSQTKAQVASILEGILKNLSSHKGSLLQASDPCPFGYGCGGGGGHMSQATKAEVANILGNILKNLQSKKGLMQTGGTVAQVSQVVVNADAKEGAEMSAAVGHELKSMLAKISAQTSASAADALKSLLQKAYPNFNDFGYGAAADVAVDRHPIDSQTKAQVASILEGVLKNLSSHK